MTPAELRTIRRSLGLSQTSFGRALGFKGVGISVTVSGMELGKTKADGSPKYPISAPIARLAQMFALYGVPPKFLIPAASDAATADP